MDDLNRVYLAIEDAANELERSDNPLWKKFAAHLRKVSNALDDCERVMKSDILPDGADAAILDILKSDRRRIHESYD